MKLTISAVLLNRALALLFILLLSFSSRTVANSDDDNLMRTSNHDFTYEWNFHDLVTNSPVILIGQVEQIFGFERQSKFRLFRVTVEEYLKGEGETQNLKVYLVESLLSDSRSQQPPLLFSTRYLLFLSPSDNQEATQELKSIKGSETPFNVYSVYDGWKGAISLDLQWRERSNKIIEHEYGYGFSKEMTVVVRSICDYMKATGDENKPN